VPPVRRLHRPPAPVRSAPQADSGDTTPPRSLSCMAPITVVKVHVAAALARAKNRALDCTAPQKLRPGVGDSKSAIGVTVKSETCLGNARA